MTDGEIVAAAAIDAANEPQRTPREIDRHAGLAVSRAQIAVEHRRRRHVAQRDAGAALAGTVGRRTMDHVDVVQRHLPRLEFHVDSVAFVEGAGSEALVERQIGAILSRR